MAKLSKIEGINDTYSEKLKNAGVTTIEKLLAEGGKGDGRKAIAKKARISEKLIRKWVNHADLFRIKGIAGSKAELLEAVGINTLKDLSKKKPDQLHEKMFQVNEQKNHVQRVPGIIQVKKWVAAAKKMPAMVK